MNSLKLRYKIKRKFLFVLVIIVLQLSCKENNITPPPDNNPPGWQENIPWPSLADSPWPMRHSDPQSTGRSDSFGPTAGQIDWIFEARFLNNEPIISSDSTIYVSSLDSLVALNFNGTLLWKIKLGTGSLTTPIVDNLEKIYSGYNQGGIYAVNKTGILNWNLAGNYDTQINLSRDGDILIFDENTELVSISPQGLIRWKIANPKFRSGASISISPDGETIYFSGKDDALIAFDLPSKSIRWTLGNSHYRGAPLIDAAGNIYLTMKIDSINSGQVAFYSIKPNGNVRWIYTHSEFSNIPGDGIWNLHGEPTIDIEGNTYFGTDTLYSLDYEGKLRWKKKTGISAAASLVCDINKNLYLIKESNNNHFSVMCLDTNGNIVWQVDNLPGESTAAGPILSYSKLFVPTQDKFLYVFK